MLKVVEDKSTLNLSLQTRINIMNTIKIKISILICLWSINASYAQNTMDCDCKNGKTMIVTTINTKENTSNVEIESHCVSILRLYIVNDQGEENEKFELDCISPKKNKHKLSENVKYLLHKPNGEFLPNSNGKDKFYKIINGNKEYYFEFTLNLNNEIIQIFEWTANLTSK